MLHCSVKNCSALSHIWFGGTFVYRTVNKWYSFQVHLYPPCLYKKKESNIVGLDYYFKVTLPPWDYMMQVTATMLFQKLCNCELG